MPLPHAAAPYNSGVIKPPDSTVSKVGAVTPGSPVERVRGDLGRLVLALGPSAAQTPAFTVGESVDARLVEPLQNRQWLAVIKGSVFTLQLPAGADEPGTPPTLAPAKGETLSLQVASLTPRLTFLVTNAPTAPTGASAAVAVQLSGAARTITDLLHASEAKPLTPLAATTETLPLLPADPAAPPAERAQALAQAISHSGLFYESHLLAWAEGRMPLSSLAREPQAHAAPMLKDADTNVREAAASELGAVLQRQLDALDGRPLTISGLAWPGQSAELRIQRDEADAREDENTDPRDRNAVEQAPAWTTQIHLQLPLLGALGAQVRVSGSQVTLAMTLDSEAGASLFEMHRGRLSSALRAAGMDLAEMTLQSSTHAHEHGETP
jgi:hypothetical protein